jgi:hypothetical protein
MKCNPRLSTRTRHLIDSWLSKTKNWSRTTFIRTPRVKQIIEARENNKWNSFHLFFHLPPELRFIIFQYLLADNEVLRIKNPTKPAYCPRTDRFISYRGQLCEARDLGSSLFLTCRRFLQEARPILYGRNTFYFDDFQTVLPFLKQIGKQNAACVANVELWLLPQHQNASALHKFFDRMRYATPNLKRLTLHKGKWRGRKAINYEQKKTWECVVRNIGMLSNLVRINLHGFTENEGKVISEAVAFKVNEFYDVDDRYGKPEAGSWTWLP